MAKRKKSKKKQSSSKVLMYTAWALALVALVLSSILIGYYFGYSSAEEKTVKTVTKEKVRKLPSKSQPKKTNVKKQLEEVLKKESKTYNSAAHEIESEALANPPKVPLTKPKLYAAKPKLAIIIDDVQTASQVRAIKSVGIPLTMSFLPPRAARPNSAKLAAHEKFYMVHLPMEAMHFSKEEPYTLRVRESQQEILQRVADIKKLFPKVAYINNHTGSKFTSNEVAMNRLIFALNKYHIHFIDSRTTAQTQAPKVMKNFGLKYVARDVFLDHHMDKPYVLGQIKKAIAVAKAHGTAIAIGHPHKNTLEALYESKKLFAKDVDLVLVNKIY
ncbi:divergent polysaccharide deacetylase family protein [Sulfurimonas paralvinellae]|uniref:Divergent polysaccharide deacetylase family protein n=1 Tax=Sulfurimonas paralvinellae TaxID=317658 RepID=A0A7M1B9E1_9BACT|nr:divergent polysaccharide deacetylase family protein [Sulfurimonas paralvinellae]QOP46261.1 divergent polysaccharide deacetylase family protein [Sulfurimonas paralvinellae]